MIAAYLSAQGLFRTYASDEVDPVFSTVLKLDLSTVVPCVSGPKRPHDRVAVSDMPKDFKACLTNEVGFKGFKIDESKLITCLKKCILKKYILYLNVVSIPWADEIVSKHTLVHLR